MPLCRYAIEAAMLAQLQCPIHGGNARNAATPA
jgi:hypothetical protein